MMPVPMNGVNPSPTASPQLGATQPAEGKTRARLLNKAKPPRAPDSASPPASVTNTPSVKAKSPAEPQAAPSEAPEEKKDDGAPKPKTWADMVRAKQPKAAAA